MQQNGANIVELVMEIQNEKIKKDRHKIKLNYGMDKIAHKMKQMQFV